MRLVIDIETEKIDNPEHIWVIVCTELDTGEQFIFREPTSKPEVCDRFISLVGQTTHWIGHHIIKYDLPIINRLLKTSIPLDKNITDTLVVSRLVEQGQEGGHSLENVGILLKHPKILFNDFSKYSKELEDRCVNDVALTARYYRYLEKYITSAIWKDAIETEHYTEYLTYILNINGFHFSIDKAKEYSKILGLELDNLLVELKEIFPKRAIAIREITPVGTKNNTISLIHFKWLDSNDLTPFSVGHTFTRFEWKEFNPSSTPQAVDRLWEYGWAPINKSKGHIKLLQEMKFKRKLEPKDKERLERFKRYGWKLDDVNLETLPDTAPVAAKRLTHWLKVRSRANTLEKWEEAYRPSTGRIHGDFMGIGAWTHRMSHSNPNMGNVPRETDKFGNEAYYGKEMRELWAVQPGKRLVGVDAAAIQLRVLAHYMDDKRFTKALIEGNKDDGTDAHTLNQKALGEICNGRDPAKRFIFAWLLGAGTPMVGHILSCTIPQAQQAVENFIEFYPGLKELKKEKIPHDARVGYFQGFDGRYVRVPGEHWVLAGYLQNGESVIMKTAAKIWYPKLIEAKINFKFVNFVHDEWQTEVDDDLEICNYVSRVQSQAIEEAGEILKLKCPLAGEAKNGYNWYQTH